MMLLKCNEICIEGKFVYFSLMTSDVFIYKRILNRIGNDMKFPN